MNPTVSIITINFNNKEGLKRTINSVKSQTNTDYEYIIIDGKSSDGSLEVILENKDRIHFWISEKDNGIFNAMNKGIAVARGDFMLFLNSGDLFVDDTVLESVISSLKDNDIVYGDLIIMESTGKWIKKYSAPITFDYFLVDTLPHQGSFISRTIFDKCGGKYDETLTLTADWKFFLDACCRHNAKLYYLNIAISEYNLEGLSSRPESKQIIYSEKRNVLLDKYARFYNSYLDIEELNKLKKNYEKLTSSRVIKAYLYFRKIFISKLSHLY